MNIATAKECLSVLSGKCGVGQRGSPLGQRGILSLVVGLALTTCIRSLSPISACTYTEVLCTQVKHGSTYIDGTAPVFVTPAEPIILGRGRCICMQ